MADDTLARRLAADLLALGAVALSPEAPFVWASGLRAPIYCDNRLTLTFPAVREAIAGGFAEIIRTEKLRPHVIVGTATAGIPHAAWLADRLHLPMAYVRSKPKGHGQGNQIEGRVEQGQRVVVIEDLISTGGSSLAVVQALRAVEAEVVALLAIFSYGFPQAGARFMDAGVPVYTLTNFEMLLNVAQGLPDEARATLRAWRADPQGWSDRFELPI